MNNQPRGILLDAVGTLIFADPPVEVVYARVALLQGVVLEPGEVQRRFVHAFRVDEGADRDGTLVTDEARERRRWQGIVAAVLPELPDPEAGFATLWEHFSRPTAWRCYDDVAPAVTRFRDAGHRLAIASNFDARLRRVVAGLPELAELQSALLISSEVGYRKPHPAFFEAACQRLGLPPGEVLNVGDDLVNDFEGPRKAGLGALQIDRRARHPSSDRVNSLVELAGLLAVS